MVWSRYAVTPQLRESRRHFVSCSLAYKRSNCELLKRCFPRVLKTRDRVVGSRSPVHHATYPLNIFRVHWCTATGASFMCCKKGRRGGNAVNVFLLMYGYVSSAKICFFYEKQAKRAFLSTVSASSEKII